MTSSLEYVKAGSLRALAVTTATRSEALPEISTVSDFVPGFETSDWVGVSGPKGTPAEIIDKLNREINAALADPKIKARLADLGGTALAGSPADFGKLIADETEKWAKVVKFAGNSNLSNWVIRHSINPVALNRSAVGSVWREVGDFNCEVDFGKGRCLTLP